MDVVIPVIRKLLYCLQCHSFCLHINKKVHLSAAFKENRQQFFFEDSHGQSSYYSLFPKLFILLFDEHRLITYSN